MNDKSAVGETIELSFPSESVDVALPEDIARDLVPIGMKIGQSMQLYGFRFFLNSKTLLKALAVMKSKKEVTGEELKEFMELANHFNWEFNPI
jgi:hypothetical protein